MKDLLFILKLFTPYKFWLMAGLLITLITSLAAASLLTLSGWFITASAIAGNIAPDGAAIAFNFVQPAAEIRALAIIRTFGRYAERLITHEATFRILAEIRCWFFAKLIPLSPGRLGMKRSADLLTGITHDIDTLNALYLRIIIPVFIAFFGGGLLILFICTSVIFINKGFEPLYKTKKTNTTNIGKNNKSIFLNNDFCNMFSVCSISLFLLLFIKLITSNGIANI